MTPSAFVAPSLDPSAPLMPLSPTAPERNDGDSGKLPPLNRRQYTDVAKMQREKMSRQRPARPTGKPSGQRGAKSNTTVIGKKVNAGVVSWKGADLTIAKYIGRCALGTTTDDVKATLDAHKVEILSLEAVQTKHNRFALFKLVAEKAQQETIENGDIWPEGVLIGRWWNPKSTTEDIPP